MAKRRGPSGAVCDLLAAVAEQEGERVSALQLERWRQAGLVPRPEVRSLGRGHGTSARYPADAPARVAAAKRAVRARRGLHVAALALFGQGQPLEEHVVRAAYGRHYEDIGRLAAADPSGDPLAAAEALALATIDGVRRTRKGRRMLRRARRIRDHASGEHESPETLLRGTLTTLARGALTGEADPWALWEMLLVTGLSDAMGKRIEELEPGPSWLDAEDPTGPLLVGPQALRRAVEEASFAELARARDGARDVLALARACTAVLRRTTSRLDGAFGLVPIAEWAADVGPDLAAAAAAPILLVALRRDGAREEGFLAMCGSERTRYEALERLLDALPASDAHLLARVGEDLPDDELERLIDLITPHALANPADVAAVLSPFPWEAAERAVEEAPGEAP